MTTTARASARNGNPSTCPNPKLRAKKSPMFAPKMLARQSAAQYRAPSVGKCFCCMQTRPLSNTMFNCEMAVRALHLTGVGTRMDMATFSERIGADALETQFMKYENGLRKVPEITLAFWVIKIAATTLGETGGDAVSMTLNWGYAPSSAMFIGIFAIAVAAQIAARSFHPFLCWSVIIATTTAGTTMADLADRSLGIGYPGGSLILFALLTATFGI